MRPLWGMEGVAGAFVGVGGHGRVKRGLASFLGTLGCRAAALWGWGGRQGAWGGFGGAWEAAVGTGGGGVGD